MLSVGLFILNVVVYSKSNTEESIENVLEGCYKKQTAFLLSSIEVTWDHENSRNFYLHTQGNSSMNSVAPVLEKKHWLVSGSLGTFLAMWLAKTATWLCLKKVHHLDFIHRGIIGIIIA